MTFAGLLVVGNSGTDGGGLALSGGTHTFDRAVIHGNTASQRGGGVYAAGNATPTFTRTTITGNTGTHEWANYGGGVSVTNTATPTFSWSNVYGNTIFSGESNFYDMPDPTGLDGNVSFEPQHLHTSATDPLFWDLHLSATSPLIDAGDPSILDPDGSPSDIGAYGGPNADQWDLDGDGYPSWWQPGPYDYSTYPALGWDCDDLDSNVYPGNGC